jgi:hypothetical protein
MSQKIKIVASFAAGEAFAKVRFLARLQSSNIQLGMISQRSVGRLMRLLNVFFLRPPHTLPLLSWLEYRTRLYEDGVDNHVLNNIEYEYGKRPRDFLPAILTVRYQRNSNVEDGSRRATRNSGKDCCASSSRSHSPMGWRCLRTFPR